MDFDPTPKGFFGNGYAIASSELKLPTSAFADITVGKFTMTGASAVVSVFDDATGLIATDHNLKVGDIVAISTATTLPAPFTAADHYVVSVPTSSTLTLSLTRNGTAIVSTDAGTGTHTLKALAPLQEVTDAEAHATTGDWRKVVYGLMELLHGKYANIPTADRPANVTITKSKSPNVVTGVDTNSYTVTIKTLASAAEVLAE